MLLYIVNFVLVFQICKYVCIQQLESKLTKTIDTNATTIENKKAKIEAKKAKANTKARITIIKTTKTKKSLRLRIYKVNYIYISLVLETTLILLSYLLFFSNLREFASNTLYN